MSVLTTQRLTIRPPQPQDFDAFAAFCAADRSKWVGGPASRDEAREAFDSYLADAAAGTPSYLHITLTKTGDVIGRAGIRTMDHRPEPEVAYSLYTDAAEGHGYASEAAIAVRDWGYDVLGLTTLVSYIEPNNTKSAAVATRMGAKPDGTAPGWDKHPDLIIFRHIAPEDRT
ncbi:GNAT family N-acetyltransferase [Aliiroseovarius subalbicans]|uniref:GNAT family N-acetyltransferase n=1 Tax=Aliiroseovarius subalbicans TaxID=2925840 RepID=UPI001F59EE0E|nr:GNAT family N-acetyltransferase [Aliiroseovarius subalbicans]MCI2400688.1 GNAT family N-acetyltransferase [Aliiroseovarius subalbicans]